MTTYRQFFQDGLAYWQEKLRALCLAFYLLYSAPIDPPRSCRAGVLLQGRRKRAARLESLPITERGWTPGFRQALAG
jgi:hypothetical protein